MLPAPTTLAGVATCLPHRDTEGPQTLECALGLRTDDGIYYALDLAALPDEERILASGNARIEVTGMLVPIELLSSDQWMRYDVAGIVRAERVGAI